MIIAVITFFLIAIIDMVPVFANGTKGNKIVYSIIFAITLTFGILTALRIEIPSIMLLLGKLFKAMHLSY